jgi:hypothetical protein
MSHLRAAQVAKRAKVLENAAAARAASTAARCAPQETLESVLREMPELRKFPVASKLFTYDDMAFLTHGCLKIALISTSTRKRT